MKHPPTQDQMHRWYIMEKRSYRWIMDHIGSKSARAIKNLLIAYGIEIRSRSDAVATQWIDADDRRAAQSKRLNESFAPFRGTQSKRPEVAAKISASKLGERNPMYGRTGPDHPNYLGGKSSWRFKRKIEKNRRQKIIKVLGGKCSKCGSPDDITIHHDPPWRIVRSHELKYLSLLCKSCHFHGPVRDR